jgi:hypothetical protein
MWPYYLIYGDDDSNNSNINMVSSKDAEVLMFH